MRQLLSVILLALCSSLPAFAGFDEKIEGMDHQPGLIDLYRDTKKAAVYLALTPQDDGTYGRYIYAAALSGGLGSNPVGLDRSRTGRSQILAFRRVGEKIIAEVENNSFRAVSENAAEVDAVRRSFAHSVIWSSKIVEEAEDGRVLIDFSSFVMRDGLGIASRLAATGQGTFRLAKDLSYVRPMAAFSFPTNLEFDAVLTFTSNKPGREVRATTPEPRNVSMIHHTTLIKLPEPGYVPRRYDERTGFISVSYVDMAQPLDGDVVRRLARRWRLEKDENGKVVNPIVYYVDNGAPEPIRSALVEGASWWATAFEKAGFPGGYRVEVLPEGAHPLDARYNVINWVHRATRGWSYGSGIADPRTGENLRGIVILGSLRLRQDIKIFESLMGAKKTGSGDPDDPVEVALARVRQLSAHEVGHTLGFGHNMAASSYGGRASVMDYPAPNIKLKGDAIDASDAYAVGMGIWDDFTVEFLYGDYEGDSDAVAQAKRIKQADEQGLVFVSDGDSRDPATGHMSGSLWDNGTDPVVELNELMALRRFALDQYGEDNLREDEAFHTLQTKIVPLYLYHRYQVNAAAKLLGGYDFRYRRQGDNRAPTVPVPMARQSAAFNALLETLKPAALALSQDQVQLLTPVGADYMDPQFARETVKGRANPAFDYVQLASSATEATLGAMLAPRRLERIKQQQSMVGSDLATYLGRLAGFVLSDDRRAEAGGTDTATISLVILETQYGLLADRLISLYEHPRLTATVKGDVAATLSAMVSRLGELETDSSAATLVAKRITDAMARQGTPAYTASEGPAIPPGSPIGAESCWHGCGALN